MKSSKTAAPSTKHSKGKALQNLHNDAKGGAQAAAAAAMNLHNGNVNTPPGSAAHPASGGSTTTC